MQQYENLDGDSKVLAFEIGHDFIIIQFKEGSMFLYNHDKTGVSITEQMKRLAFSGNGLDNFIELHVKGNHAAKLR